MNAPVSRPRHDALPAPLAQALGIAEHYGFVSLDERYRAARAERREVRSADKRRWLAPVPPHAPPGSREDVSAIIACLTSGVLTSVSPPALLYRYLHDEKDGKGMGPLRRSGSEASRRSAYTLQLEVFGMKDALGEALLIRAASAILDELKQGGVIIHINSVGDRETAGRFFHELSFYYRRYAGSLAPCCRTRVGENLLALMRCTTERCSEVRENAPKSISYLHDSHRRHLKEVLEYLEGMDIPYAIDEALIEPKLNFAATIFELRPASAADARQKEPFGYGGRYEGLARRTGIRGALSGVALSLTIASENARQRAAEAPRPLVPRILFIQLGADALRRGLVILELLRRARIPVLQALGSHSLSEQVVRAERESIPYTVIIGHREALDGTAIVRNTATRSQETIPVSLLPRYFKTTARVR
ncbi:MAG: His/Gly/Thr/Pro-type tRNA ligase C-terminal domain-containing protein [bacterium]|nr:His/Gly/Thr/Pro-type tRNA ligase C-terminal domain-containing protein [bacterium]MDZ4285051.1 His/Gly/Thr/Pro-type tRNA ligase C-terminal domain-containing protein [Patescibacteria group bacterium]